MKYLTYFFLNYKRCILQQNLLRRNCNSKCIKLSKGHYLEVMVEVCGNLGQGAQWLSGRVLDGCGFEPHWRHCGVSLSKALYPLLSTGSTQELMACSDN